MAQYTPSGMPLLNYARFTPSGYPYNESDESDNDVIATPENDWSPFSKRREIENSSTEEIERREILTANAERVGKVLASLSQRERLYMLSALPGRTLNALTSIPGWDKEVQVFKETCFQRGRMNILERMRRYLLRRSRQK